MYGAIPNPKKTVTIDFPIEKVKVAARNIDKVMKFCHFREENDMFNSYKFSRSEFLSLGALININLNSVSENKTQVDIEISRQIGAFDEWIEIDKANKHIGETINAMSSIIKNGIPVAKPQVEASDSAGPVIFGTLVGIGLVLVFFWIISILFG